MCFASHLHHHSLKVSTCCLLIKKKKKALVILYLKERCVLLMLICNQKSELFFLSVNTNFRRDIRLLNRKLKCQSDTNRKSTQENGMYTITWTALPVNWDLVVPLWKVLVWLRRIRRLWYWRATLAVTPDPVGLRSTCKKWENISFRNRDPKYLAWAVAKSGPMQSLACC